jgi:hypothetical protein
MFHHGEAPPDDAEIAAQVAAVELMSCSKRALRLTVRGCAAAWTAANQPKPLDPWMSGATCRDCPIGAMNATGEMPDPFKQHQARLQRFCSRCGRDVGNVPGAFVWRTEQGLCRPCDARHGEAKRGLNSKGSRPALADRLHSESVQIVDLGTGAMKTLTRHFVTGLPEVMRHHAKFSSGPVAFHQPAAASFGGAGGLAVNDALVHVIKAPVQLVQPVQIPLTMAEIEALAEARRGARRRRVTEVARRISATRMRPAVLCYNS